MFGGAVPGFEPSDDEPRARARRVRRPRRRRCSAAPTPGCFDGAPDEIAELLWGSMHGLVMLELVGINPRDERSHGAVRPHARRPVPGPGAWLIPSPPACARWSTARSTASSTNRSTSAPPRSSRTSWPPDRSASAPRPAATTVTAFVAAATPMARRALAAGVEVGEGRVEGPAAVVEGAQGRTGVDPGRAAPQHHQPAGRARAPAAGLVPDRPGCGPSASIPIPGWCAR